MNAETLVVTVNQKGERQPVGTKIQVSEPLLKSYVDRGIVKELKAKVRTKEFKMKGVKTKTQM